jgi:hypothetical protein
MAGSIPAWSAVWMDFAVRDALAAGLPWTHIAIEDTVRTLGVAEAQFSHGVQEQNFVFAPADSSIGLANIRSAAPADAASLRIVISNRSGEPGDGKSYQCRRGGEVHALCLVVNLAINEYDVVSESIVVSHFIQLRCVSECRSKSFSILNSSIQSISMFISFSPSL